MTERDNASHLEAGLFDADQHYYEAEDAFTRHMDPKMARQAVQWAVIDGRKRLLVGGRLFKFIPNPTFDPVAKPGCLDDYFRGENPSGKSMVELMTDLEPICPEYRNRDARLALLDKQGVDGCILWPTLALGLEQATRHSAVLTHACLEAFNRWLDEDWGFAHEDRIYAAPMISLMDVDRAVSEFEWALERGARVVHLRFAPVPGQGGSRSPGDSLYDPFWARVNEAGITVGFHAADSGYGKYAAAWERRSHLQAFRAFAFGQVTQVDRSIFDTMAALIIHGVFKRFPRVRVCSIENGSTWVGNLLSKLKKAHGQLPHEFGQDPVEAFRRHVWVAPYFEEDIHDLADVIGVDHVLMGTDFPHAEGVAEPRLFYNELGAFDSAEVRKIMHDNPRSLIEPSQL